MYILIDKNCKKEGYEIIATAKTKKMIKFAEKQYKEIFKYKNLEIRETD